MMRLNSDITGLVILLPLAGSKYSKTVCKRHSPVRVALGASTTLPQLRRQDSDSTYGKRFNCRARVRLLFNMK